MSQDNPAQNNNGSFCPVPLPSGDTILLAHGGGGRLMHQLIDSVFRPAFSNPELEVSHDAAVLNLETNSLVMTTDSYVIQPLFFPGGDIGSLAINGTVNDLAMAGARPLYLSVGFILEEGLPVATLQSVVHSMRNAAIEVGVRIVTGDTKVVPRGQADGIYINTTGVGELIGAHRVHPESICEGDRILLSGDIGRHGMAVMAVRENLEFETPIESDCRSLAEPVYKMISSGLDVHCMRDLTRGGLATGLIELAQACGHSMEIEESSIPVREEVRGFCEILGFDPLYVANEGCFVTILGKQDADRALQLMNEDFPQAVCIGQVVSGKTGAVSLKTRIGSSRILDLLSGDQLPRIC